jgi:hypothetical protein
MTKVWRLLSISIIPLMCLGLLLVPAVATPVVNADGTVGIEVVPSMTKVGYNETFDVNITITDTVAQNMAAWTVYMTFNTTLMNVTGIDKCTMLPTGHAPDDIPGYPKYNNTTGVIEHQSGTTFLDPYVNTSFVVMTVHCRSNAVAGTGSLNFKVISSIKRTWVEDGDAIPVLDWSKVFNGTVRTDLPKLTVNVTPANKGNVTINSTITPSSYPNTTNWSWNQSVTLEAVESVPNWTFTHWSGDLNGSANPTNITMDWDKNVTANFVLVGTTATLEGHVDLTGLPATNVTVRFFAPNTTTEYVAMKTHTSTDSNGNFTIPGIDPGTYDVGVKGSSSLSNLESGVNLIGGGTTYRDFGVLLEGDASGDDYVDGSDFGPLSDDWLKWGDCFGWSGNWT